MAESDSEAAYIYTTSKSLTAIEAQATLIGIVSNDLTDAPKSEAFLNRSISALTRFRDETKRGEIRCGDEPRPGLRSIGKYSGKAK